MGKQTGNADSNWHYGRLVKSVSNNPALKDFRKAHIGHVMSLTFFRLVMEYCARFSGMITSLGMAMQFSDTGLREYMRMQNIEDSYAR